MCAALAATLAEKIHVPVEIFLFVGSLIISLVPGLPTITLSPKIIFSIFFPPILFSAAYFTSWRDFKANKRPITLLAIGLVLFTTCAVAITIKFLIPTFNWPLSFLLGAIVSPTDASSAVSLVKKLNVPRRLITIIEGESLINDATALIAYRYTLTALITGAFSFWDASFTFVLSSLSAIILGVVVGYLSIHIYSFLKQPQSQNIFTLIIPYFAFLLAERLHISAVVCTVVAGLYVGRKFPMVATPESRHKATTIWEIFIFAINSLIFILMGLQLRLVVHNLSEVSLGEFILYAIVINLIVLLARFIWVFPASFLPRFLFPSIRKVDPYPHWTQLFILSWIGMRGIISLAAAIALPVMLPSGQPFPHRSLIILLTYSIILVTLLLPIITLPFLVRVFKFGRDDIHYREEALARIRSAYASLEILESLPLQSKDLKEYVTQLVKRYKRRIRVLESNLKECPYSSLEPIDLEIRRITKKLLNTERQMLLKMRNEGEIHDEVFHRLEAELDIEYLRLKTQRI